MMMKFSFYHLKFYKSLGIQLKMDFICQKVFSLEERYGKEIKNHLKYRTQSNAKIECLHQKYEAFKALIEKIDNLMILSKSNVINVENIEKFFDMLIDIQNNFSKEFNFIRPCTFSSKTVQNNSI
jgi:hypothetical protein